VAGAAQEQKHVLHSLKRPRMPRLAAAVEQGPVNATVQGARRENAPVCRPRPSRGQRRYIGLGARRRLDGCRRVDEPGQEQRRCRRELDLGNGNP